MYVYTGMYILACIYVCVCNFSVSDIRVFASLINKSKWSRTIYSHKEYLWQHGTETIIGIFKRSKKISALLEQITPSFVTQEVQKLIPKQRNVSHST